MLILKKVFVKITIKVIRQKIHIDCKCFPPITYFMSVTAELNYRQYPLCHSCFKVIESFRRTHNKLFP
jgi:hypothetical protein